MSSKSGYQQFFGWVYTCTPDVLYSERAPWVVVTYFIADCIILFAFFQFCMRPCSLCIWIDLCCIHSEIYSSPFEYPYFFEQVFHEMFWTLLGYTAAKAHAIPRNLTWFTRQFLLVRVWGLGTRLIADFCVNSHFWFRSCSHPFPVPCFSSCPLKMAAHTQKYLEIPG